MGLILDCLAMLPAVEVLAYVVGNAHAATYYVSPCQRAVVGRQDLFMDCSLNDVVLSILVWYLLANGIRVGTVERD